MLKTPKRNRYFRGKLLDVDHFELEQSYFNEKRWLINRLGIGSGVLDGLTCEPFGDGQTVRIQPGVAIDAAGREIILSEPSIPFRPRVLTDVDGNMTGSRVDGAGVVQVGLHFAERSVDLIPSFDDTCAALDGCSASAWEEGYTISVRPMDPAVSTLDVADGGVVLAEIKLPDDGSAFAIDNSIRTNIESNAELLERILALDSRLLAPQAPIITKVSWKHGGELSSEKLSADGLEVAFSEPLSTLPNAMGWVCITIEYPAKNSAASHGPVEPHRTNPLATFPAETIAEQRLFVACRLIGSEDREISLQVNPRFNESFKQLCAENGCQKSGALCRVRIKCNALSAAHGHNTEHSPFGVFPAGIAGNEFESWFTLRPSSEV